MPKATKTRTPHRHHNNRVVDVSRGSSALKRKDGRKSRNGKAKSGTPSYSPINSLGIDDDEDMQDTDALLVDEEEVEVDDDEEAIAAAAAMVRIRKGHEDPTQENDVRNIDDVEDGSTSDEDDLLSKYANFGKEEEGDEEESGEEDATEGVAVAAAAGVGRRQSVRIKKKVQKAKVQKATTRKSSKSKHVLRQIAKTNAQKDAIKLDDDWKQFTPATVDIYYKNKKGFYIVMLPGGIFKVGFIYTEGQTRHCLSERLRHLTATIQEEVWVKMIDTGNLSQEGVKLMEDIAKFSLFALRVTNNDGVVQSRSLGGKELYELNDDTCDMILKKLLGYAKNGRFSMMTGNGIRAITHTSVEKRNHPMWREFNLKTNRGRHRNDCPWKMGDVNGLGADYYEDWGNFSRDPQSTCRCMTTCFPGIDNIGNTCYLSAMLQFVFCVPDFLSDVNNIFTSDEDYDEAEEVEEEVKDMPLTKALLDVATTLGLLGSGDAEVADPTELKALFDAYTQQMIAEDWNPSEFARGIQHDPHEFWVCFFDIWKEEHPRLESLIKDYFHLEVEEGRECDHCNDYASSIVVDPLSVAIGDNAEDEPLSIEDLVVNHFQTVDSVAYYHDDEDDDGCGEHTTATKSTKITKCPKALLVHIKRFDAENQKNEARIHLTDTLSLPHHEEDNDNCNYRLCGVLNHIGGSVDNGHCTAITKKGDQWIHYNDAIGTRRSISYFTGNEYKQSQCYMALYIQ